MEIQKNDRVGQQKELLSKIAADINEDDRATGIKLDRGNYPGYVREVWSSLFKRDLLRRSGDKGVETFYLKPRGWLKGIQLNGEMNRDSEFVSRLKRLCTTLRKFAKNGNSNEVYPLKHIALEANVPEEWLANVIDSESIEYRFRRVGVKWQNETGDSVWIPTNVGLSLDSQEATPIQ